METQKSENGILVFPEALQRVPVLYLPLIGKYYEALVPWHGFYLAMKEHGYYPKGKLEEGVPTPDDVFSPYNFVRRTNGHYETRRYTESDPFKKFIRDTAEGMHAAADFALTEGYPEGHLIASTLRPQADALKRGDFRGMMVHRLNAYATPPVELDIFLMDRYLDTRYGAKFAAQGWVIFKDRQATDRDEKMVRAALEKAPNRNANARVLAGDVIYFGGLPADRPWSGNTAPSEDDLRKDVAALSFLFQNVMADIREERLTPALLKYIPQVTEIDNWERRLKEADEMGTVMHEFGHSQVNFDSGTSRELRGNYMPIKELLSEQQGRVSGMELPDNLADKDLKRLFLAARLTRWRLFLDEFLDEKDPNKRKIASSYAQPFVWQINFHERAGSINVNPDNGVMTIEDFDSVAATDRELLGHLRGVVSDERHISGTVDRFVQLNARVPRAYIPVSYLEMDCDQPGSDSPRFSVAS